MRELKSWRWLGRKKNVSFDQGIFGVNMKQLPFMGFVCTVMLFIVYRTTNYQYQQTEIDDKLNPFYTSKDVGIASRGLGSLPRGIIHARTDLELKPLWSTSSSRSKVNVSSSHNLLAIPAGIKQKSNVDAIVQKFLSENFTIILFHYDGKVDGWWDLEWSKKAIHIIAHNQTKWWFAKRFLHPAVVSIYDYIFLWDEDLGVENFHPQRYLNIVKSEGLEISQPALHPNSTEIHHRITIRLRTNKFHRRVWEARGSTKCSGDSEGPPCTGSPIGSNLYGVYYNAPKQIRKYGFQVDIIGSLLFLTEVNKTLQTCRFVEGMAPVFSRSAWHCAWHLIQNDLVHGWGMDMKLGYCAQGDRTRKVGIIDSEYVFHHGIQTLGGASAKKVTRKTSISEESTKKPAVDVRIEIRRQSTWELEKFKKRWEEAVKEDKNWVDPFPGQRWPKIGRKARSRRLTT